VKSGHCKDRENEKPKIFSVVLFLAHSAKEKWFIYGSSPLLGGQVGASGGLGTPGPGLSSDPGAGCSPTTPQWFSSPEAAATPVNAVIASMAMIPMLIALFMVLTLRCRQYRKDHPGGCGSNQRLSPPDK
jgi:hypothetical protein